MTRSRFASLAIASAIALPVAIHAARPHYGGTLRIEMVGVIRTFDPAATPGDGAEATARTRVLPLVFEPLVAADPSGGVRPLLAASWERDAAGQRWRFHVRSGVMLHDGSRLQPAQVAAALRGRERPWKIGVDGDAVTIDLDRAQPDLPWDLADTRYGIAIRTASGDLVGSGPFRLEPADPRRVVLRAHEDYWAGRPFVDAVEIAEGRPFGEQLASLELGRADVVAVRPTDLRRLVQRGLRSTSSRPLEVFALVFEPHRAAADDGLVRRAVAASIDRGMLSSVLLQRQAEPAAALLPSWLSGYAPMFQAAPAPAGSRATAVAALSLEQRRLTLRVDPGDPVAQAIAERVAVDAREAGIMIKVQTPVGLAPRPDVRLVRIAFDATTPDRALAAIMTALGARTTALATTEAAPAAGASIETVYRVERALVERDVIVPVVHLPIVYGLGDRVESWNGPIVSPTGAWNLANVWLRSELIVDKAERPDPRDRR
jgi:peptide/nickel transport system substrate-binding protein